MYFIYILQSLKDQRTYVGYTDNVGRRLIQHKNTEFPLSFYLPKSLKHLKRLKGENCVGKVELEEGN